MRSNEGNTTQFNKCFSLTFYQEDIFYLHKTIFLTQKNSLYILANGNDSKKFKGDRSPCSPSRVLHLRKIPNDVSEAEVISLGLPFGKVTNLLMLKGKSQVCTHSDGILYPFM